jgi:hypothetical protein
MSSIQLYFREPAAFFGLFQWSRAAHSGSPASQKNRPHTLPGALPKLTEGAFVSASGQPLSRYGPFFTAGFDFG